MNGASRKLTVSGIVLGSTWATCETAQDGLVDVLGPGLVMLEVIAPGQHRVIDGVLDGQPQVTPFQQSFRQRAARFSFALRSLEGMWRAPAGNVVAIPVANTRYPIPQGTAPTNLIIRVMGSATNPTVTVRGSDGQTLAALVFTVTLSSSEWLDIDNDRGVIEKVSSGTRTDASSLLTSGTFRVRMDLGSWNYKASQWPTVEVSSGTAEVLYTPRYW